VEIYQGGIAFIVSVEINHFEISPKMIFLYHDNIYSFKINFRNDI